MQVYRIATGIKYDVDRSVIPPSKRALVENWVHRYASEVFGGVTVIEAVGSYRYGEHGETVTEPCWIVELWADDAGAVWDFARSLCRNLNQESVGVTSSDGVVLITQNHPLAPTV